MREEDLKDIDQAADIIAAARRGSLKGVSFIGVLEILQFFLDGVRTIMFKNGKPKTKLQIILSIPAIIRFIRTIVRMIKNRANGDNGLTGFVGSPPLPKVKM